MKKAFYLVVEFRGNMAFSPFENAICKALGRNESGSGFSFLDGKREITGWFRSKEVLDRKIEKLKVVGKENRVKLTFTVYEEEA